MPKNEPKTRRKTVIIRGILGGFCAVFGAVLASAPLSALISSGRLSEGAELILAALAAAVGGLLGGVCARWDNKALALECALTSAGFAVILRCLVSLAFSGGGADIWDFVIVLLMAAGVLLTGTAGRKRRRKSRK